MSSFLYRLLYGCWIKTASSMLYSFHQNMYPRETWTTAWNYAGQPYNLCNNRNKNCRELKWWWHHACGLTPRSFPAHLHSSLLEGVAGHAICAEWENDMSYYAGGGEERFTRRFMKEGRRWVEAVNQRKSRFVYFQENDFAFVMFLYLPLLGYSLPYSALHPWSSLLHMYMIIKKYNHYII